MSRGRKRLDEQTINIIRSVLSKIVLVFMKHGVVDLFIAGPNIVIQEGKRQIVVPSTWVSKRIQSTINERYYSIPRQTSPLGVIRILRSMLDHHMYIDLINIDKELDAAEYAISHPRHKKPSKTSPVLKFRPDPDCRVHHRFIEKNRKYLLVSGNPANSHTLHELPMYHQLSKQWTDGSLFKSFCLLHETRYDRRRVFEIDALGINGDTIYLFEMKNQTCQNPKELLIRFEDAVYYIQFWRTRIKKPIKFFVPILYLRKKGITEYEYINYLYYDEVRQGHLQDHLKGFRSYLVKHGNFEMAHYA